MYRTINVALPGYRECPSILPSLQFDICFVSLYSIFICAFYSRQGQLFVFAEYDVSVLKAKLIKPLKLGNRKSLAYHSLFKRHHLYSAPPENNYEIKLILIITWSIVDNLSR